MVPAIFDVAVAGLGAMGSSALAACARRGVSCIGFERYEMGHGLGSSGGKSRLIRQAYFEHPAYVPLVLRAYELWDRLERETQTTLLEETGLLMAGGQSSRLITGSLLAAREYDLPVEALDAAQVRKRFPQVRMFDGETGVFERKAGVLNPEAAVRAQLDLARQLGAEIVHSNGLQSWSVRGGTIHLRLDDGSQLQSKRLVLATGPWMLTQMESIGVRLRIQRNVQVWFAPNSLDFSAGVFPAFMLDRSGSPAILYGFPDTGVGVKAAFHGYGDETDPDSIDRTVHAADVEPVASALEAWMPGAASRFLEAKVCMYSLTGDENFVVDRHPESAGVILLGGFSGHGFKFACVVGEIASQIALDGGTEYPIELFSIRRLRSTV